MLTYFHHCVFISSFGDAASPNLGVRVDIAVEKKSYGLPLAIAHPFNNVFRCFPVATCASGAPFHPGNLRTMVVQQSKMTFLVQSTGIRPGRKCMPPNTKHLSKNKPFHDFLLLQVNIFSGVHLGRIANQIPLIALA